MHINIREIINSFRSNTLSQKNCLSPPKHKKPSTGGVPKAAAEPPKGAVEYD